MIETNLSNSELDIFYSLKENQLFHINEPNPGLFIAESPYVIERALAAGYEPHSFLIEKEQLNEAAMKLINAYDVPAYVVSYEELKNITGYHMSRGMLCAMKRKPNPSLEEVCAGKRVIAVLENTMNPTNVGAIIRSAAALSVEGVLLTKGCANPLTRRASRVSMGNVFSLDFAYMDSLLVDVYLLKKLGFTTVSMALSENAVMIDKVTFGSDERLAIILGTEGPGLDPATIAASDYVVKIPMAPGVDSLNVAAASAVAFWVLSSPYRGGVSEADGGVEVTPGGNSHLVF